MSTASETPVALSFFDQAHGLHGTIRSGLTLLFQGRQASADRTPAEFAGDADTWTARVGGEVDLKLRAVGATVELGGIALTVCRAEGRAAGTSFKGLGVAAETTRAPEWSELESLRAVSAVFSEDFAVLAVARRPKSSAGHGEELVHAALIENGELRSPEDTRISTVYDSGGRQHSSGLELWFPGEDYPRRLFGTVQAGTSLELGGLLVHAAAFTWRMEGNTGAGLYELTLRTDDERAAAA